MLEKRIAYATSIGSDMSNSREQYGELTRAIATSHCQLAKGMKSIITEKRYGFYTQIIIRMLPNERTPDTTTIEGMFLINIIPWSTHNNVGEYAELLLR